MRNFFLSLSLTFSFYLYLSLYIYITLTITLSLYLSHSLSFSWIQKKNGPPVSTPNRRRPGAHRDRQYWGMRRWSRDSWGGCKPRTLIWCQFGSCICFFASKGEAPMAGEVGVGAIGAGDSLMWGPSGDISGWRRHNLVCLYPGLIHIVARSHVQWMRVLSWCPSRTRISAWFADTRVLEGHHRSTRIH